LATLAPLLRRPLLHRSRGISPIPADELDGEQWFLHAVGAIGELMAEDSTGPSVTDRAYTSRVTGHTLQVLAICAAWLRRLRPPRAPLPRALILATARGENEGAQQRREEQQAWHRPRKLPGRTSA